MLGDVTEYRIHLPQETKKCPKCGHVKAITDFYHSHHPCKECVKQIVVESRRKNNSHYRERNKESYLR